MITTGKVVALIKAMGGGADPAVIESAVQDWLDAHPEATTTVQDGSITEQKLATSIAQKLGLITQLSDEMFDVKSAISPVRTSINLLPDDGIFEKTQLDPNTGTTNSHSVYKTSDYIPCKPMTDYRYSVFDADGNAVAGFVGVFCYYDENKENLSGTGHTNVGAQTVWTTPANAAYFRIQAFDTGAAWMITEGTFFKAAPGGSGAQQRDIESIEFVPYNNQTATIAGEQKNPLIGKYLIDFGDSIERGDATNGKGIGYLVAKCNQMAYTQFAVGGMTIADTTALYKTYDRNYINEKSYYTSDGTLLVPGTDYTVGARIISSSVYQRNVLSAYLDSAENANIEPDYIIIEGGTNDISSNVTLGDTIIGYTGSFDTTTFAGALEDAFKRIRTKWPYAKIIFVRVHNMNSRNAEKQVTFGEMAKKVCNKWSIKFADMYNECGLNTNIENMKTLYTINADGTHPNADGYKLFYQEPIISALRSR